MSKDRDTKSPHSVLVRLGNKRMPGQSVQNAQTLFVLERFLARVAQSQYRDQLILKGGILLYLLTQQWVRPTEDLDLLAIRIPGESLDAVLAEILGMDLGDRLEFQAHLMTSEEIREDTGYPCRRYTIPFQFGPKYAKTIKLDVSVGDPVTPGPKLFEVHSVLAEFQCDRVQGYPLETYLAEKVETVLSRGLASTRAKDVFDLWVLSRTGLKLRLNGIAEALRVTADYRAGMTGRADSVIDLNASALKPVFGTDPTLKRIWTSYVSVRNLVTPPYEEVVSEMQAFIRPLIQRSREPGIDANWNSLKRAWE